MLILPQAAQADAGSTFGSICLVTFCLVILFCLLLILAGIAYVLFLIFRAIFRLFWPKRTKRDPVDGKIRDGASFVWVTAILAAMSLEGLPEGFDFDRAGSASATRFIAAPTQAVVGCGQSCLTPAAHAVLACAASACRGRHQ